MLDRKTKNLDASVELLKDRKDDSKGWVIFSLVAGAVIILLGSFVTLFDVAGYSVCVLGVSLLVLGGYLFNAILTYNVLIQAKRMMETQQVHTDLLDEMLNSMDSLEKNVNKKAGRK